MRKLIFLLALLFPFVAVGISVRIAFNEWIIDYIYAKKDFPKDRYGLPDKYRKELAKLGLRAVLSDEAFEEFKRAKLPNGKPAFRQKEVKHMHDVKELLKKFFPAVYIATLLWIVGFLISRSPEYLILSGLTGILTLSLLGILVFTNYNKAFEIFHLIAFDPHSWRFRYTDTLLRIYPMKFWYEATKVVALMSFLFNFLTLLLGILWKFFKDRLRR
ncbi:TIGR01906 family membrane protein [Aquifex sp.]